MRQSKLKVSPCSYVLLYTTQGTPEDSENITMIDWKTGEKQGKQTSANSIVVPMSVSTNQPFKQVARAFFGAWFAQLARARAAIRTFPSYRRTAAGIWTRINCVVLQQCIVFYLTVSTKNILIVTLLLISIFS